MWKILYVSRGKDKAAQAKGTHVPADGEREFWFLFFKIRTHVKLQKDAYGKKIWRSKTLTCSFSQLMTWPLLKITNPIIEHEIYDILSFKEWLTYLLLNQHLQGNSM